MQSAPTLVESAPVVPAGAVARPRRGVLSPAVILMAAFLLSRLLGMVRQVLFSAVFGTYGTASAAYVTAFRAPELIFNLVSGGTLTSAFLPTFASYLAKKTAEAEEEAWRVASTIFYMMIALLLPMLILGMVFAPRYVPLLVPSHDQALIDQTIPLTRIMLLQPLFMSLITICQGISNAYLRFTAPALAPLVYNLTVIAGVIVGKWAGISAVAWSVALGAALQFAVQVPWLPYGWRLFRSRLDLAAAGVREIGKIMLPRLFGQAGIQASFIVTTALANLLPDQPNNALTNGWTLMLLPVGIFAAALGNTAFPVMARQAASADQEGFAATVRETMSMVFFLTIPAAAGLIVLAPRVVRVLFAYGAADNSLSVHLLTLTTVYYAVGIPGHALAEVLPRAFFALKDSRTPVLVVIWTLALAILLSTLAVRLIPGDDAVGGLALAVSIAVLVEAINLTLVLYHRVPELSLGPLGWSLVRANVAAGVMTAGLYWCASALTRGINISHFGSFVSLCVCVPLGVVIYLAVALLLRAPEAGAILSRVSARLGR